ncbi:MAG: hypothetical protein BGO95_08965 [Micrococcales bacterium 73-13]|nr:MAG: hypothetical protein BGO95_08965 [Micrococcales bacterium 73-13]
MSGRLTLSWANKDRALVSDGAGGYRWVDPDDPRAREVRLLEEVSRHGDGENLLIRGDGLAAMRSLARIPEYARRYRGRVRLVYIDPPFNTGQAFEHYDDALEHSVWLGMMRERLEAIRELLAPDGSVWVHLDDAEMAYCKVLMDEVFGRRNFVATVVWQKLYAPENRTDLSSMQDYLLVYASDRAAWKSARNLLDRSERQTAQYRNPDDDPRGPWKGENFTGKAGPGRRAEQFYTIVSPAGRAFDPPPGRCWVYTRDRYQELLEDGRIWFGRDGTSGPSVKRFLDEVSSGVVPGTWWAFEDVGHNQEAKQALVAMFPGQTPFDTPKPERLLQRIVHIASNPGDIVLDAFAGSGTTAAVAHKMRRGWVAVEREESTVEAFTRPRLAKVVDGEDRGGITEAVGWIGGGGFRELRVAPPTYRVVETAGFRALGLPAVDGATLARSVAAQLGYEVEPDLAGGRDDGVPSIGSGGAAGWASQPFAGRKGRARLAVVAGVADESLVDGLLAGLDEGETLTLATTMAAPGTAQALRARSRGSRLLLVPHDLFRSRGAVS